MLIPPAIRHRPRAVCPGGSTVSLPARIAESLRGPRRVIRAETAHSPAFALTYTRSGPRTAHPALVIPGGPGLASVLPYGGLRRRAAREGLDLIMVEHRGVGLSRAGLDRRPLPVEAMRITEVVDDLLAVLDAEGIERAHLVGSSYGSYLASCFGARHPERVAGMVLDSALQSSRDLPLERAMIRELLWDSGGELAWRVRALAASLDDDRRVLDMVRAAYELGGEDLLIPLLRQRRPGRGPRWSALEAYAGRDASIAHVPGVYEFGLAGVIGFRELGYGAPADGLPLDPALTYAELAHRYPAFAGEPWDLLEAARGFSWPMLLLSGSRDLRTPPEIARRTAELAPDAVIVPIANGHSALDTHPLALIEAIRHVVAGTREELAARAPELDRLPHVGLSARFPDLLGLGLRRRR